ENRDENDQRHNAHRLDGHRAAFLANLLKSFSHHCSFKTSADAEEVKFTPGITVGISISTATEAGWTEIWERSDHQPLSSFLAAPCTCALFLPTWRARAPCWAALSAMRKPAP